MSVLVGKKAPDFTVPAVLGNGEIVDSFNLASAIKASTAWCSSTRWTSPSSARPS